MSAPAVAAPVVFAEPGKPECGKRDAGTTCGRPPKHQGGHVSRLTGHYWQAEEPQS